MWKRHFNLWPCQSSFYFCSICYAIANKANLFLPAQSLEISIKRRPIILSGSSTNGSRNMVQFSSSSTLNRNISSSATFETAKDLLDKQSNIYSGRTISLYGWWLGRQESPYPLYAIREQPTPTLFFKMWKVSKSCMICSLPMISIIYSIAMPRVCYSCAPVWETPAMGGWTRIISRRSSYVQYYCTWTC